MHLLGRILLLYKPEQGYTLHYLFCRAPRPVEAFELLSAVITLAAPRRPFWRSPASAAVHG
ncbi:hypothetical protein D3C77_729520 [compost metagenome]